MVRSTLFGIIAVLGILRCSFGLLYEKLGMQDRRLSDLQITASSCQSPNHCTDRARLNLMAANGKKGAWCALTNTNGEWIQVDLRSTHQVAGVMTQGRSDAREWVTSFSVHYSLDGLTWTPAMNAVEVGSEVFEGNTDSSTIETNDFAEPLTARFIRFLPTQWQAQICMRFEIVGKVVAETAGREIALGMKSGVIPDDAISASSSHSVHTLPIMGRLDSLQADGKGGSWTARTNDGNQWIKVDLRRMYHVTSITTHGRPESDQWVTRFKIAYSPDGITWSFVKDCADNDKIFVGNSDPDTNVTNTLVQPVRAQLLRIHPTAWHERISMTFEVFGIGPVPDQRFDPLELGMQDRRITDSRLSASSCYNVSTCASRTRLGQKPDSNGIGAWSAGVLDHTQWIQVDLTNNRLIQGVVTQGRYGVDQWVSSFKMTYKQDGYAQFQDVLDTSGVPQVFAANEDRNSYAVNAIAVPVTARFVRIHPVSWVGHISMRFELFGHDPSREQRTPRKVGIADGRVSSTSLVASSCRDRAHCADHSRLGRRQIGNVGGAWIAGASQQDEWIQVDLRSAFEITGVTTQGRHDINSQHNEWVTSYSVWYSIDGRDWTAVTECNPQPKVFPANFDKESTVHNAVSPPFTARFVRLQPVSWNNAISLRWELVGKGPVIPGATHSKLGIEDKRIPDAAITASSFYSASFTPQRGRLNTGSSGSLRGAWIAQTKDQSQWLQVDLQRTHHVTGVITQGRSDSDEWVTGFKVAYSKNGRDWLFIQARSCAGIHDRIFTGNSDRSSLVTNEFAPALTARFVRLVPQSWHQDISMRIELLGEGVVADISQESLPLGLEDYVIPNVSMTASSVYSTAYPPSRGRLRATPSSGLQDAWAARTNNANQWLQIDLTNLYLITGLATQGRSGEWVRTYKVACSADGQSFHTVKAICPDGEEDMIFTGNSDRSTVVTNALPRPELCRLVRLLPVTWYGHISARLELYGKGPIVSG